MKLFEKWRPRTLDEVVGQPEAVALIRGAIERGELAGNCLLIRGESGRGKTTLAQIVGWTLTGDQPGRSYEVQEWDASDISLDWIREYETHMRTFGMSKTGRKVCIVNEADNLTFHAVGRLKTTLEALPDHCTWIFTSARMPSVSLFDGAGEQHEEQFISRCMRVVLRCGKQNELDYAIHLRKIADAENLNGCPLQAYIELVRRERGNLRACIQEIAGGHMKAIKAEGVAA